MKDYVGCMVERKKDEIFLHQTKLIKKLGKEFENILSEIMAKEDKRIQDKLKHTKYRSGVGILFFCQLLKTRYQ